MYFYGNARTALYYGLKKSNVKPGDKILMPSILCSSVLEPINSLKMTIINYSVDTDFSIDVNQVSLQINDCKPDIFLFINYFGSGEIPEDIVRICKKFNILCIIDNSHFFYEDYINFRPSKEYGFVIYSIRKILPLHTGGLLIFNNKAHIQKHSQNAYLDIKQYIKYLLKLRFRKLINRLKLFSSKDHSIDSIKIKYFQPSYIDKVSVEKFYNIDLRQVSSYRNSCWKEWSVIFSDFGSGFKVISKLESAKKIPWSFALYNNSIIKQRELLCILLKAGVTAFIWPDNIAQNNNNSYLCIVLDFMPKDSIRKNLLKLKNNP